MVGQHGACQEKEWEMEDVCIDFTDLNKATPKDNYPLPRMDQVVDSVANTTVLLFGH
jgi:hypothetical protein